MIYIFGLGLGYAYDALQPWLAEDSSRNLIFLEDDIAVIGRFLESKRARQILQNPQVRVTYIEDSEEGKEAIQALAWGVYPKKIAIEALPFYRRMRGFVFEEVKKRLFYETAELHAVLDEYLGFGVPFFRNFWKNVFFFPSSYQGARLFSQFRGIPAIVVGAGPSLQEQLPLLRKLSDRALILAGGSSVNALMDAGITPHLAAGIDPNPMQYLRLRQGSAFTVPFFFRNRMLHEALTLVSGQKLYLPGGDGYNISEYFEEKLKIRGKVLGGGHSVSNFLIEIAHALGCGPIIMVGYDLAYSKNMAYAPGVEESQQAVFSKKELGQEGPIPWKDIAGNPISTQWKWVVEAEWIAEYKKRHPTIKLINATEGGIGMRGVSNSTLSEVAQRYLRRQYDMRGCVHHAIETAAPLEATDSKVLSCVGEMYDSLQRVVDIIQEMLQKIERAKKGEFCTTAQSVLLFEKLEKEEAFQYVLEVFCRMKVKLDTMHEAFMDHLSITKRKKQMNVRDKEVKRLHFLKEVSIINQLLIAQAVEEYAASGHSIKAFCPKAKVFWS